MVQVDESAISLLQPCPTNSQGKGIPFIPKDCTVFHRGNTRF